MSYYPPRRGSGDNGDHYDHQWGQQQQHEQYHHHQQQQGQHHDDGYARGSEARGVDGGPGDPYGTARYSGGSGFDGGMDVAAGDPYGSGAAAGSRRGSGGGGVHPGDDMAQGFGGGGGGGAYGNNNHDSYNNGSGNPYSGGGIPREIGVGIGVPGGSSGDGGGGIMGTATTLRGRPSQRHSVAVHGDPRSRGGDMGYDGGVGGGPLGNSFGNNMDAVGLMGRTNEPLETAQTQSLSAAAVGGGGIASAANGSGGPSLALPQPREGKAVAPKPNPIEPPMPPVSSNRRYLKGNDGDEHYNNSSNSIPQQPRRVPDICVGFVIDDSYKSMSQPRKDHEHIVICKQCKRQLKVTKTAVLVKCPACQYVSPASSTSSSSSMMGGIYK